MWVGKPSPRREGVVELTVIIDKGTQSSVTKSRRRPLLGDRPLLPLAQPEAALPRGQPLLQQAESSHGGGGTHPVLGPRLTLGTALRPCSLTGPGLPTAPTACQASRPPRCRLDDHEVSPAHPASGPRPRLSSEPLLAPGSSCWDGNSLKSQWQRVPHPHLAEGKLSLGGGGGVADLPRVTDAAWGWLDGTGTEGAPGAEAHSPRDFIPMKRFSTMSMRPTPCLPLGGERAMWGQARP